MVAGDVRVEQRFQHAERDVGGVQVLLAHEIDVGARKPTAGRPCIPPAGVGREARIGAACGVGAADELVVLRQILPPPRRQIRIEIARGFHVGMDVGVDDADPRGGLGLAVQDLRGHAH